MPECPRRTEKPRPLPPQHRREVDTLEVDLESLYPGDYIGNDLLAVELGYDHEKLISHWTLDDL